MQKERQVSPVSSSSSSRPRVSPYPLRSSRNNSKQKGVESPLETEGSKQWEDVRCVICLEPPHNAVLLHCSSFSKGCRSYMCDTTARHSNCFKQFRRKNNRRYNIKTLKCPLCRGEVCGTMKVTSARRFMNAKPRSCCIDNCDFCGTYSQLKNHVKAEHSHYTPPKTDPWKKRMLEQLEREAEYIDILRATEMQQQRWETEQRQEIDSGSDLSLRHSVFQVSLAGVVENIFTPAMGDIPEASHQLRDTTFMPRLQLHSAFYHGLLQRRSI